MYVESGRGWPYRFIERSIGSNRTVSNNAAINPSNWNVTAQSSAVCPWAGEIIMTVLP